jgi:response regulator NasT
MFMVDAPLGDEYGATLAVSCASIGNTILLVKKERYEHFTGLTEPHGVLVLAKPISAQAFRYVLKAFEMSYTRIWELRTKLEDTKLIDRAKLVLVTNLKMTEPQAHKHIERQAMDRRVNKREVAMGILKTYEE